MTLWSELMSKLYHKEPKQKVSKKPDKVAEK